MAQLRRGNGWWATPLSGFEPVRNLVFGLVACFEVHTAKPSTFSDPERVSGTAYWTDDGAVDRNWRPADGNPPQIG